MSNDKKPAIRFKDYSDDWEQRKLGNMMDVTSVKRIHQSDWTDSGVRFLRSRDIVAESKNEEVSEPIFISQEKYDEYSAVSGKVEKGDLLVTGVGTIGVPMLINSEEPLYFKDGNIIWFKNKNAIDGRFFYHSFKGLNIQKFIKESAGTGTVGTYTIENGKKTPINLPLQKEEQEKIGEYFSNLDNLIALHQRKYDKLQNLKKAMLKKMFPKNGSNVPEIRFKGFTDAWEQRKFSELVTIERGGSPRPIDKFITKDEDGLNWVKIGDAPEQGNYITKTAEKIKPEGLPKTREVHPGDLILSNSMSFGKPYIMAIDGCIHDGWLAIRDTNKMFDLKFLCIMLGTDNMLSQYKAMAAGSTVNNLNKELVGGTTVSYPPMEEQVKLGEYFSNLDHLITLHQRELEKLKNIKKAMLEKMFV